MNYKERQKQQKQQQSIKKEHEQSFIKAHAYDIDVEGSDFV